MTWLLAMLWPGLLATFALGAAVGWLAGLPRTRSTQAVALGLLLVTTIAVGVAATGIVPGRAGFWVESTALGLGTYLAGAVIASFLATANRSSSTRP